MRLSYYASVWKEGDSFVAAARPLDVLSAGESDEEAVRMLAEAVELFAKTAEADGTLSQILEECGYRRLSEGWVPPEVSTIEASVTVAA